MASVDPQVSAQTEQTNSKIEKKAKKVMTQLSLTPVEGISRVVFRRPKGMMLAVSEPRVFKSEDNNTYVVLGEVKVEDLNLQAQQAAAERLRAAEMQSIAPQDAPAGEEEEEEEEVDETGVGAKDIELVMSQASVSRAKAVKALKNNGNDIVNSIMSLTT